LAKENKKKLAAGQVAADGSERAGLEQFSWCLSAKGLGVWKGSAGAGVVAEGGGEEEQRRDLSLSEEGGGRDGASGKGVPLCSWDVYVLERRDCIYVWAGRRATAQHKEVPLFMERERERGSVSESVSE